VSAVNFDGYREENCGVLDSWLYLMFLLAVEWLAAAPASLAVFATCALLSPLPTTVGEARDIVSTSSVSPSVRVRV